MGAGAPGCGGGGAAHPVPGGRLFGRLLLPPPHEEDEARVRGHPNGAPHRQQRAAAGASVGPAPFGHHAG